MSEAVLNAFAQQLLDMTLCKTRYDLGDLQWYTEGPFWRRTSMRFSREYKIIPDYEIGDIKHGKTLENILDESGQLLESLKLYKKTASPAVMRRTEYLIDHVKHLNTRTRLLLGETIPFDTMTDELYCLVAPAYDYAKFDAMLDTMNQALPGAGSVGEKILAFKQKTLIPPEHLLKVLTATTQKFHDITMERMNVTGNSMPRVRVRELPTRDQVFISILFGYDYDCIQYERNFNLLYPWTAERVVEYIGHEMEPGHLTYFEKRLQAMIDTCYPEMAMVSQFSSSSAFSEGSARHSIAMSFDNSMEKQLDFEREYIFKPAKLDTGLLELMPLWHEFCEVAGYGKLEVSRKVWDGIWTRAEAGRFLEQYTFSDPGEGEHDVDVIMASDDGHFVAHDYSRDKVREYFAAVAPTTDEQWRLYEVLCSSHMSMRGIADKTFKIDF